MQEASSSTFARGLHIIEAFGPSRPRMTLADLSHQTGLDRAVVRRLANTLVEMGYANKDGRVYELTPRILALGHAFMAGNGWGLHLSDDLDALSRDLGETVSLSVWSGTRSVTLARSNAAGRHLTLAYPAGGLPINVSTAARMLMSELPDAEIRSLLHRAKPEALTQNTLTDCSDLMRSIEACRRDGHIVAREELEIGLIAMSVPVRDRSGRVVAALNVSSHTSRMSEDRIIETVLPTIKRAAGQLAPQLS